MCVSKMRRNATTCHPVTNCRIKKRKRLTSEDIQKNIRTRQLRRWRHTIGKSTPTPNRTNRKRAVVAQKPTRRLIDARRKSSARKFLLKAWRMWKVESAVGLKVPITSIPEKGPLPTQLYGKSAATRERVFRERQQREVDKVERQEKHAAKIAEFQRLREVRKARASEILIQQAKTREQLPLYQAVLDSYKTSGGWRGYRYSSPEEAAKHRKLYQKAYSVIWRWTKFREKEKRVDKRPPSGPGVAAFYREIATTNSITCHYCRKEIPPVERTVDHYIPLARGGSHSRENLVAACAACNQKKSATMPDEFLKSLRRP